MLKSPHPYGRTDVRSTAMRRSMHLGGDRRTNPTAETTLLCVPLPQDGLDREDTVPVTRQEDAASQRREHWDDRYDTVGATAVSWFQNRPTASLDLIAKAGLERSAGLIDVGGGASSLVDALLADGWSDVTVLDVSEVALGMARERVGADKPVRWIAQDLLTWQPLRRYDVWH